MGLVAWLCGGATDEVLFERGLLGLSLGLIVLNLGWGLSLGW